MFALVCAVSLMGSIASTSIAVAFPVIVKSFSASLVLAGWVLSANQLVATAVMPLTGRISDAFGRKRTFMAFLGIFMGGSVLCALAPNIPLLIVSRVIQAIGSSGFMPSATGIVADEFPASRREALGFLTTVLPVGQIAGPVFGGWVTHLWGWQAVFWVNIPLGLAAMAALAWLLKPGQSQESRIDLVGAGLFAGALCAFMIGLSSVGNSEGGQNWAWTWSLLAASAGLLTVFLRHERVVKDPIIDLEVLTRRPFVSANIYNIVYGACIHSMSSLVPLYAVTVYGMSTFDSGFILAPKSMGMMLAAGVTSLFLARWGYRWPMLVGTLVMAFSLWLLGGGFPVVNSGGFRGDGLAFLVTMMVAIGIGTGVVGPAANNACIELMPHRIGTIAGIRGMFRHSGGAVSITLASILLQNVGNMADSFSIVFYGLAAILIVTVPFIFIMTQYVAVDEKRQRPDPGERAPGDF